MVNKRKRKNPFETASAAKKCLEEEAHLTNDSEDSKYAIVPQEILLHVFKFLTLSERCKVARVCKAWKRSSYDKMFWDHIDLSDSVLDTTQLWKLVRRPPFYTNVQSLKLCGNLKKAHLTRKNVLLTKTLMKKIADTCQCLEEMDVGYYDLNAVGAIDFPTANLRELRIIRCEISAGWFELCRFKKLEALDLSWTSRVARAHFTGLLPYCKETLVSMKLTDCYRVNDKAVEVIVGFKSLRRLDLQGTDISQYGLQLIVSKIGNGLEYLNLTDCKNLSRGDVNMARSALANVNIEAN